MHPTLQQNRSAIADLCRKYGVERVDAFGSAGRSDFDPEQSDFDFVVDFGEFEAGIGRRYIEFADALESLLGRHVDLVFEQRMKPRFRAAVDETREVLFASGDRPVAA